ncbi:MAG: serine hydrolase [Gemmatimonadota bacterium]
MGNGRTGPAIVRWTAADSADVVYGDIEAHVRVSDDGSVLGYALPNQDSHVVRVDGAHPLSGALTSGAAKGATIAAQAQAPARAAAAAQTDDSVHAALVSAVEGAVKAAGTPGAQVLVMRNGQVLLDRGFGVRKVDDQAPVDVDTRFEIGSITKQFTAAAVLQLVEQEKLSLDDTLGKFVPEYAAGAGISLRQLLWQVSGIPNYTAAGFAKYAETHDGGLDGVLELIRDKPLEFKPGTKWKYSNSNYFLLGRVVEVASGMPWEQYIRTHIFQPAGMTHSTFTDHEFGLLDMATGYERRNERPVAMPTPGKWPGAAGAIVSTVGDLSKWDDAFFAGRIVSPEHVKIATTPGTLADGSPTGYGFGWFVNTQAGQARVYHTGGTSGFASVNETFPDLGERIIVLVNQRGGGALPIASAAFYALNPEIAAAQETAAPGEDPAITKLAREWWQSLLSGKFDRSRVTPAVDKAFTPAVLRRSAAHLETLGAPKSWVYKGKREADGITAYTYRVTFESGRILNVTIALTADGKLAGYGIRAG